MSGRMIDAIREHGITYAKNANFSKDPEIVFAQLSQAEPIVADDVFRYCFEVASRRTPWCDLPCVAPPYQRFWLEGRVPPEVRTHDGLLVPVKTGRDGWKCSGYYAQAVSADYWRQDIARMRDPDANVYRARTGKQVVADRGHRDSVADQMQQVIACDILDAAPHWVYSVSCFVQNYGDEVLGPTASVWIAVDQQGRITNGGKFLLQNYTNNEDAVVGDGDGVSIFFDAFFLAVSLFHVKNARLEPTPELPAKMQRARAKRGKPPLLKTTTIVVDPVRETLRRIDEARERGEKVDLAIHQVRAHFKTFTSDRPLFGRTTGRFFWPVTVRGSREHGERKHVYDVKAPEATP